MKNRFVNFKPARLHISKIWYISYYVEHPQTRQLVRKRIKINHIKSIVNRRQYANLLIVEINKKLANGWNPFIEQEAPRTFFYLKDALALYLEIKKKELRESSIASYISVMKILQEWLSKSYNYDELYIYTIDNNIANKFMQYLYISRNVSERSYNNYRSTLVTIWNWLVDNGYSKINVFSIIHKKKTDKKIRQLIDEITLFDVFEYLKENDKRFYAVCLLTYYGLLRPNEILQLKSNDFDLTNNVIIIRPNVSKTGRQRIVTIPNKLSKILVLLEIKKVKPSYFLFSERFRPGLKRITSRAITAKWDRLRIKLSLPSNYQYYSLKDTGIVAYLKKGIPPNVVRDQAGHTDLSTTNKYIQNYLSEANNDILEIKD